MRRPRAESGFTIPEVMVAMVIMLVGLGGGLRMLDSAAQTTTSSKAREQGTALLREVLETARSVRFDALPPTGTAAVVQGANATIADADGGAGWTVVRRGVRYAVAVGACVVDDPGDGIGVRDAASYCATGTGTATPAGCRAALGTSGDIAGTGVPAPDCGVDTNRDGTVDGLTSGCAVGCTPSTTPDADPADFKRVVALVRWRVGTGDRFVLATTTIPGTGGQGGVPITALVADAGTVQPDASVRLTAGTSLGFTATTAGTPPGVRWEIDGVGLAGGAGSGTTWSVRWPLGTADPTATAPAPGEVLDGVRSLQASTVTADGRTGATRALTVVLDRRAPFPPQGVTATNLYPSGSTVRSRVAVQWSAGLEGDVVGYDVRRRVVGSSTTQVVCPLQTTTTCNDDAPPAQDTEYWVVAYDGTTAAPRAGARSAGAVARAANARPSTPTGLRATVVGEQIVLTWNASTDPDGDAIVAYRIVVDGNTAEPVEVPGGVLTTEFDRDGASHSFTVAAVDAQGLASPASSAVTAR